MTEIPKRPGRWIHEGIEPKTRIDTKTQTADTEEGTGAENAARTDIEIAAGVGIGGATVQMRE